MVVAALLLSLLSLATALAALALASRAHGRMLAIRERLEGTTRRGERLFAIVDDMATRLPAKRRSRAVPRLPAMGPDDADPTFTPSAEALEDARASRSSDGPQIKDWHGQPIPADWKRTPRTDSSGPTSEPPREEQ